MRTTLDIADDVLYAAKEIAQCEKKSLGHVVSELARQAFSLRQTGATAATTGAGGPAARVEQQLADYGIQPIAARGAIVSNELIDRLRDAEGI